jgi:hypothetical protein
MLRRRTSAAGRAPSALRTDSLDDDDDSKLAKTLKRIDMYARVSGDLTVKTESGATVTVVFWLLLVVLVRRTANALLHVLLRSVYILVSVLLVYYSVHILKYMYTCVCKTQNGIDTRVSDS